MILALDTVNNTIFSITYCEIPVLCQICGIFLLTLTKLIICIHYSFNLTIPWLSQRMRPKRNCLSRHEESQPRPRRLLLQREVERQSSIPPPRKAKHLPKVTPKRLCPQRRMKRLPMDQALLSTGKRYA